MIFCSNGWCQNSVIVQAIILRVAIHTLKVTFMVGRCVVAGQQRQRKTQQDRNKGRRRKEKYQRVFGRATGRKGDYRIGICKTQVEDGLCDSRCCRLASCVFDVEAFDC